MLKKLVKYGNSNALIFDKAILELLNIKEGSLVKIRTDGISLIITPHEPAPTEQLSPTVTNEECITNAALKVMAQNNPGFDFAGFKKKQEAVFKKYESVFTALDSNQEFLNSLREQPIDASSLESINERRYRYAPELRLMDEELTALSKEYNAQAGIPLDSQNYKDLLNKFVSIHKKNLPIMQQVAQLATNEDYQNECALLSQKYNVTEDAQAYLKAYSELNEKYVPGYLAYQEELKKVGESLPKK